MIDFIKKIFKKIGWLFLGLILAAIALFSIYLGLASVAEIIVKIAS